MVKRLHIVMSTMATSRRFNLQPSYTNSVGLSHQLLVLRTVHYKMLVGIQFKSMTFLRALHVLVKFVHACISMVDSTGDVHISSLMPYEWVRSSFIDFNSVEVIFPILKTSSVGPRILRPSSVSMGYCRYGSRPRSR